jgi:predicted nucleotidyltransferase/biotin operon repressor
MAMYKLKFTRLQNEIFRLLCIKTGEKISQRQAAFFLGVSTTAVAKAIPLLEKEGLIKVHRDKRMNLNQVELERDNAHALEMKKAENLKLVSESGLSDFLEEKFAGCTIILFGSYSRGDDTVESDIDIAIIGSKQKAVDLSVFEGILEREVIIQFYGSLKGINKELRENIVNGIVLAGRIEL